MKDGKAQVCTFNRVQLNNTSALFKIFLASEKSCKRAAPVAERLRALFLNHLIISKLCLVWVGAPLWPHVRQAKFCLQVVSGVFSRGSPVFAPSTDWSISYELKFCKRKKKILNFGCGFYICQAFAHLSFYSKIYFKLAVLQFDRGFSRLRYDTDHAVKIVCLVCCYSSVEPILVNLVGR